MIEAGCAGMTLRTDKGAAVMLVGVRHFTERLTTHDLAVNGTHTY
jgi:hypothetical protein